MEEDSEVARTRKWGECGLDEESEPYLNCIVSWIYKPGLIVFTLTPVSKINRVKKSGKKLIIIYPLTDEGWEKNWLKMNLLVFWKLIIYKCIFLYVEMYVGLVDPPNQGRLFANVKILDKHTNYSLIYAGPVLKRNLRWSVCRKNSYLL